MLLIKVICVCALPCFAVEIDKKNEDTAISKDIAENTNVQDLLNELKYELGNRNEQYFDVEDVDDLSELRRILQDHGFNPDTVLYDSSLWGIISNIPGLFKSGDGKRWTTLNFAYQLACYQGRGGSMLSKALWAFRTYNGYACYCGSGDYHGNYLDATDYCCKIHDQCYTRVQTKYKLNIGCQTYAVTYSVSCCKNEKITKCTDAGPSAGRELCECDQAMSRCVARHHAKSTYKSSRLNNRSKCKDSSNTKPRTMLDLIKSCKDIFKPKVTFPTTYGSQGSCPAQKKKGWWWGKRKDQ